MPAIDFRAARARLPLAEVLELLGFEPRSRSGNELRGPCPVHGSRSPRSRSFAAHLGKNIWHCFRCGAGGQCAGSMGKGYTPAAARRGDPTMHACATVPDLAGLDWPPVRLG